MSDPRFSRLKTDPRFRRPKRKQQKVVVDERFKSVFEQAKGTRDSKLRVDKYGRKISETHEEDALKRYYRLESGRGAEEEGAHRTVDYARGEILMESSDEENDIRKQEDNEDGDGDSSDAEHVRIGGDDEPEIDLDEDTYAELDAQAAAYAKIDRELTRKDIKEDAGVANRTRRLAVINLDWDYVRALHLYKIFSSLVSATAPYFPVSATSPDTDGGVSKKEKGRAAPVAKGAILSVRVYPSDFGRARMEREEKEGPPPEIFKKKRRENEEINEKTVHEVGDENEYDEDALRRYQLERLRYYYAIVECDTVEAASHIYNVLEGTELERSANVFDLSFVPDDMQFDVQPRDEATEDPLTNYRPVEYVTDALRHSKVKLTWDEDDPQRYQVTRRQLTRQEIEEADFRAYIASSSSEDEGEESAKVAIGKTKNDKEVSRQKLRALLLSGNDDALPEGWNNDGEGGGDVDMEITFTPGLSEKKGEEEETTLEKYQRKIREKRKKKKEEQKRKAKGREETGREKRDRIGGDDEFFDFGSGSEEESEGTQENTDMIRGDKKSKKRSKTSPREESTAEELALIASSDYIDGSEPKHFNMKAILKAEKRKGGKKRKGEKGHEEDEVQEEFQIDVNDERFRILHEDHQFAIDPSNPHFKKTKGMKTFLEERQRRQREIRSESAGGSPGLPAGSEKSLKNLVDSVKRKSQGRHGNGKKRRL